jgi:hypothetical protein
MKTLVTKAFFGVITEILFCLIVAACGADVSGQTKPSRAAWLKFAAERRLGQSAKNPSTPFLVCTGWPAIRGLDRGR